MNLANNQNVLVTICTPTYNRASLLPDLYDSLKMQTSFAFEWVIVDDGSTDNTQELIREWMNEDLEFKMNYIKKKNGGKHTAVNEGVRHAMGKYFIIVDSDDYLAKDAIKIICREFAKLPSGQYAGVGFNRIFEDGVIVGSTFDREYVDCTSLMRKKYHIAGDKAEVFFTKLIQKYPFPVFPGEKFLTEAIVWNRIANDGYKIRWINQGLYICRYQPDGLSMNSNINLAFKGYTLFIKELLSYKETVFSEKIRWLGVYADVAVCKGLSYPQIAKEVQSSIIWVILSKILYRLKKRGSSNARINKLRINQK